MSGIALRVRPEGAGRKGLGASGIMGRRHGDGWPGIDGCRLPPSHRRAGAGKAGGAADSGTMSMGGDGAADAGTCHRLDGGFTVEGRPSLGDGRFGWTLAGKVGQWRTAFPIYRFGFRAALSLALGISPVEGSGLLQSVVRGCKGFRGGSLGLGCPGRLPPCQQCGDVVAEWRDQPLCVSGGCVAPAEGVGKKLAGVALRLRRMSRGTDGARGTLLALPRGTDGGCTKYALEVPIGPAWVACSMRRP
jgi:hypothetical protein